jgi:hypothetical protein
MEGPTPMRLEQTPDVLYAVAANDDDDGGGDYDDDDDDDNYKLRGEYLHTI